MKTIKISVTDLDGILLDSITLKLPDTCSQISVEPMEQGRERATGEVLVIGTAEAADHRPYTGKNIFGNPCPKGSFADISK